LDFTVFIRLTEATEFHSRFVGIIGSESNKLAFSDVTAGTVGGAEAAFIAAMYLATSAFVTSLRRELSIA
jgi:hypothetical protein